MQFLGDNNEVYRFRSLNSQHYSFRMLATIILNAYWNLDNLIAIINYETWRHYGDIKQDKTIFYVIYDCTHWQLSLLYSIWLNIVILSAGNQIFKLIELVSWFRWQTIRWLRNFYGWILKWKGDKNWAIHL